MKRNEIIRTLSGFMDMNKDRYEIIRIGVFGSAARDSMNEQSDVDVVVELGEGTWGSGHRNILIL